MLNTTEQASRSWHAQLWDCAQTSGDVGRLALRLRDAEALRLVGVNPQRAALILF